MPTDCLALPCLNDEGSSSAAQTIRPFRQRPERFRQIYLSRARESADASQKLFIFLLAPGEGQRPPASQGREQGEGVAGEGWLVGGGRWRGRWRPGRRRAAAALLSGLLGLQWPPDLEEGVGGGGGPAVVVGWPAEGEAARERRRPGGAGSPVGGAGGGGEKKDGAAATEGRGGVLG